MTDTDTAVAAEPITLEAFDPAGLLMDANARSDAEATVGKAFVAVLKAYAVTSPEFPIHENPAGRARCGNYVPITIVRRPDGQLRVRAGHRRNIGCMRAGVPVLGFVAGDEGDERADRRARLIEQWNENHHREQMTVRDDTAVLRALFDEEEMTEAAIAKATGLVRSQVAASLTVARSEVAMKAAEDYPIDLLQAATIAGFEGDDDAVAELLETAEQDPAQFGHTAERLRQDAKERRERIVFTAGLEDRGYRVWPDRNVPWTRNLHYLRDAEGNQITPEIHEACPGKAVAIDWDWDWAPGAEAAYRAAHDLGEGDIEFGSDAEALEAGYRPCWQISAYMCADPDQYGHRNVNQVTRDEAGGPAEQVASQIAAEEAARIKRRQVIAGNKQWRAATTHRQEFLRELAARKTPPARALTWVLAAIGGCDWDLINALQKANSLAGELLGFKAGTGRDKIPEMITQASDKRATVIALTVLLASREIPASDEHVWREDWQWASQRKTAASYLSFLRDQLGYTLSPIEAAVAAGEQFDPLAADAEAAGQDGLTAQEPGDQDEGGKDVEADDSADVVDHQADEAAGEDEAPASTEAG
jgi:ParB family transcriptional regulator, chromosome partitioning protein